MSLFFKYYIDKLNSLIYYEVKNLTIESIMFIK